MIDTITKDKFRKQSAAEIEKLNREKKSINKRNEGTSKPFPKKAVLKKKQPEEIEQQVTLKIQI